MVKIDENNFNDLLDKCCETLSQSGVIIIPTETVYGIICDATNIEAVDKIYLTKGRSNTKPLQILMSSIIEAKKLAIFNKSAEKCAETNWPGALTIILPLAKNHNLASNFNSVNDTVGIRIPNSKFILRLLEKYPNPISASSANISGQDAADSPSSISEELEQKVDLFLEGEKSKIGISSTVVDYTDESKPVILRQGSVII